MKLFLAVMIPAIILPMFFGAFPAWWAIMGTIVIGSAVVAFVVWANGQNEVIARIADPEPLEYEKRELMAGEEDVVDAEIVED